MPIYKCLYTIVNLISIYRISFWLKPVHVCRVNLMQNFHLICTYIPVVKQKEFKFTKFRFMTLVEF